MKIKKRDMFQKLNYDYTKSHKEKNTQLSKTVRNDSYTIREILQRYQGGINPDIRNTEYFDEENLENIDSRYRPSHDLTELDMFQNDLKSRSNQIQMMEQAEREKVNES